MLGLIKVFMGVFRVNAHSDLIERQHQSIDEIGLERPSRNTALLGRCREPEYCFGGLPPIGAMRQFFA
jgi:hypothetical protein